jgi:hypothetical protein
MNHYYRKTKDRIKLLFRKSNSWRKINPEILSVRVEPKVFIGWFFGFYSSEGTPNAWSTDSVVKV